MGGEAVVVRTRNEEIMASKFNISSSCSLHHKSYKRFTLFSFALHHYCFFFFVVRFKNCAFL